MYKIGYLNEFMFYYIIKIVQNILFLIMFTICQKCNHRINLQDNNDEYTNLYNCFAYIVCFGCKPRQAIVAEQLDTFVYSSLQ